MSIRDTLTYLCRAHLVFYFQIQNQRSSIGVQQFYWDHRWVQTSSSRNADVFKLGVTFKRKSDLKRFPQINLQRNNHNFDFILFDSIEEGGPLARADTTGPRLENSNDRRYGIVMVLSRTLLTKTGGQSTPRANENL